MVMRLPSETEIITYRVQHQCSFMKAKNDLMKAAVRQAIQDVQTLEQLKMLILFMLDEADKHADW